ncbi:MAG: radical SAM protein, partial [archaeon]
EDDFFQNIMLFTNGLALDKDLINKIMSPKIEFLINLNNPNKIGKEKYEKTCQNIQYLSNYFRAHNLPIRARLGINIDKKDFDYKYIIDKTLEFGFNAIRYSIIVPNTTGEQISLDYYKKFIPQIINFLNDCHKNNIMTSIDCNNIPKCLFTKDDLINMSLCNQDLVIKNHCGMPLDVDIDLNCTRCFPFFESNSINLRDFNNIEEIMRYFHYTIDRHRFNIPTFKECVDCQYFKENKCQGACLTYKF